MPRFRPYISPSCPYFDGRLLLPMYSALLQRSSASLATFSAGDIRKNLSVCGASALSSDCTAASTLASDSAVPSVPTVCREARDVGGQVRVDVLRQRVAELLLVDRLHVDDGLHLDDVLDAKGGIRPDIQRDRGRGFRDRLVHDRGVFGLRPAARLPMLATLTVLPTLASFSKPRLTLLANSRFDSVARRTCFDQMSGENTPSEIVLSTNSVAPVATGYPLSLVRGMPRVAR